jgi:ribosomal protein S18 acetylase RimI-like enzyme
VKIRQFEETDRAAVIGLWEAAGLTRPWNDPDRDIDRKVGHDPGGFLVGELDGAVVAAAMYGYDGHRGSVFYLAVHPDHQRDGHGRALMEHIEVRLMDLGCPKVNVMIRHSNAAALGFYERLGYGPGDGAVGLGKRLIADGSTE